MSVFDFDLWTIKDTNYIGNDRCETIALMMILMLADLISAAIAVNLGVAFLVAAQTHTRTHSNNIKMTGDKSQCRKKQ